MLRNSLFGLAASLMTLGVAGGTTAVLHVATAPAAIQAPVA